MNSKKILLPKKYEISGCKKQMNTHKLNWNVSTIRDVFLNQKRINVCERTVKMTPCDAVFSVCSHTFILFWLRKTYMSVEIHQLSFHVLFFVCLIYWPLHLRVSPLDSYFCVIHTSVPFLPTWSLEQSFVFDVFDILVDDNFSKEADQANCYSQCEKNKRRL